LLLPSDSELLLLLLLLLLLVPAGFEVGKLEGFAGFVGGRGASSSGLIL
jgi:hypothetical protein